MAQKRMFDKSIILSDAFLEMPDSSQNLYFHLSMNADDDGFIDNYKSIMRMTGKRDDDMKILLAKKFILSFEDGIIIIKHWRINNYIRSDRYSPSKYKNRLELIKCNDNQSYSMLSFDKLNDENSSRYTSGIPVVNPVKNSIVKNSIVKSNINNIDIYNVDSKSDTENAVVVEKNSYEIFEDCFGRPITAKEVEIIEQLVLESGKELVNFAFEIAVKNNAKKIRYVESILQNWKSKGITTISMAIQDNNEFETLKKKTHKQHRIIDLPKSFTEDPKEENIMSDEDLKKLKDRLKKLER